MASSLSLTVGAKTRTKTSKVTDAKMKRNLELYVNANGHDIPADQLTADQLGDAVLLYLSSHIIETIAPLKKAEINDARSITRTAEAATDAASLSSELDIWTG